MNTTTENSATTAVTVSPVTPQETPVAPVMPAVPPVNTATVTAPQKADPPAPPVVPNPQITPPTNPTEATIAPAPTVITETTLGQANIPSGPRVGDPPIVVNTPPTNPVRTEPEMKPVVKTPETTPEVQTKENNGKINVVVHNTPVEKEEEKKEEKVPSANNTLKPIFLEDNIQKAPPSFSPMIPIEQTPEGKGLSNILVIGSEVIHVTHPGQRFRSQGGFNVLYIGSSEKELRDLYGIKTDSQLCAMQRAFGVRYMHQKPEIESSDPPCALQDKAIILNALQTRLKTLGHQLSIVPDNLVKARYLVQRKYLQDLVKKIESTPGDAKPCPVVERREFNVQGPNLKDIFSGMSKSSDCLQNMQLLQQLMMIMMLLLGSVSDKDVQGYLDQIPLEKILQIVRTPKPSRNNLDVIQDAIDSLYTIYRKRQQSIVLEKESGDSQKKNQEMPDTSEGLQTYIRELEAKIRDCDTLVDNKDTHIGDLMAEIEELKNDQSGSTNSQGRIAELEAELENARRQGQNGNASKQAQIDELETRLEEANRRLQELQDERGQVRRIYEELYNTFREDEIENLVEPSEIDLPTLLNYIQEHLIAIDVLNRMKDDYRDKLPLMEQDAREKERKCREEIAELRRRLAEAEGRLGQAGSNIEARNAEFERLQKQLEEAEENLRRHITEKSVGIMKQAQQEKKLTAKNAEIEGLRQQLTEAEGRVGQAGTNVETRNAEIQSLREQLAKAQEDARSQGDAKNAEIQRLRDQLSQIEQRIPGDRPRTSNNDYDSVMRNLDDILGNYNTTRTNSSAKNTRIADLERQLVEAQAQAGTNLTTKNATIEDLQRQLAEAQAQAGTNSTTKNATIEGLQGQLETARQTIAQLQENQSPPFDSAHLEQILGVLLTDRDLRTRANSYIQGRENTNLLADLGIYTERSDEEVCKIYNTLQQLVYTQERFFYTLNDKTYNLDGDIFQEYFNSVPAYENKDLLKELVTIIRDIISLRSGSVVTTGNLPILQSIINSKIKTGKNVQYTGLMTELKSLYNKHKFMTSSIKTTTDPRKLQIGTIEPSSTNNYVPGMIFYIRFVQLSKKFIDTSLNTKCGTIDTMVGTETTARVPTPSPAIPPTRGRSPSPGRTYRDATANPYVGQKSDTELYRR